MLEAAISLFRPVWFRGKYPLLTPLVPRTGEREAAVFGYRMRLDLADFIQRGIFLGAYEGGELARVRRLLKPGGTFVDVGANVGFFSLGAARRVGPTGRVVAIEPSPYAVERLQQTVAANGIANVRVVHAALGERRESLPLFVPPPSRGNHAPTFLAGDADATTVTVPVLPLDDALDEWGLASVDVMKVDVEGHELAVFHGGERALRAGRVRHVLCEFHDVMLRRAGSSPAELHAYLLGLGFEDVDGAPVFPPGRWPNRLLRFRGR